MKPYVRSLRLSRGFILAAGLALCAGSAFAGDRDDDHKGGDHGGFGFGNHPSLPVPAALIFGGLAVAAVAGAVHRRNKSKQDAAPKGE